MNEFENIRKNAELVIMVMGSENDVELGLNAESVEWVDGFIERQRVGADADKMNDLTNSLGSFLGECIRENFGGEWQGTEHGLGVVFEDGNAVFPFSKTAKHFFNGADDSIYSFYKTIPFIINLDLQN